MRENLFSIVGGLGEGAGHVYFESRAIVCVACVCEEPQVLICPKNCVHDCSRVASPTWGPPPPCKLALNLSLLKAKNTKEKSLEKARLCFSLVDCMDWLISTA